MHKVNSKINEAPSGAQGWSHVLPIPNSLYGKVGGGWQPTFNAESKSAKNPKFPIGGEGGLTNFQLLMPSPNLLKSPNSLYGGAGGGVGDQLPTFNAESRSAQFQIPYLVGGEGGLVGVGRVGD